MVFENGTSTYLEHVSTFSISLAYDWLEGPLRSLIMSYSQVPLNSYLMKVQGMGTLHIQVSS